MTRIPIDQLVGVSVLEIVRQSGGPIREVQVGQRSLPLEAAAIDDVFYVPSVLAPGQSLQIVGSHSIPLEAVLEEFTPQFVRKELLKRGVTELPDAEETVEGTVCILGNVFSRN